MNMKIQMFHFVANYNNGLSKQNIKSAFSTILNYLSVYKLIKGIKKRYFKK